MDDAGFLLAQRSELVPQGAPLGDELRDRFVTSRGDRRGDAIDRRLENSRIDRGANGPANGTVGPLVAGAGPVGRSA